MLYLTYLLLFHSQNTFVAIVDLPEGEHQYKFYVDGQWTHDPAEVSYYLSNWSNKSLGHSLYTTVQSRPSYTVYSLPGKIPCHFLELLPPASENKCAAALLQLREIKKTKACFDCIVSK